MKNSAITMDRQQFLRLLCGGAAALATGLPANAAASGSIKVSFRSSIKRIDPAFAMSGDEYAVTQALYDNLTTLDDKFAPRPSLAESWSSPDQGRTWVFKLRSGVRFHTGREFDAEDVAFSIKRVIAKDSGSPGRRAIGPIEDVVATDPRTVTFKLEVAYADFPTVMAQTFARIVPRDGSGNLDQKPVGTGPFKFAEWMPGQHVRLVANEDYWQSGTPKVKDLWFVTYPAQAAEQAALSSGETQVMWEVAPSLVSAIKGIGGVELTEIPSTAFQPLVMRSDRPPFNDVRVRQAVKHAINRDAIMKFVTQGRGTVAQDTPVAASSEYYAPIKAPAYDPAKAKALLAAAGHPNGFPVRLFATNERAGCIETAQVVKPMLEAVGIKVEIQQVPWDRFIADVWKKEIFFVSNWIGRATIDEQLYPFFHSSSSWNEYNYANPEIDKLLDSARGELDPAARKATYAKVQQILADEGPAVVPYFANYIYAISKKVENVSINSLKWVDVKAAMVRS